MRSPPFTRYGVLPSVPPSGAFPPPPSASALALASATFPHRAHWPSGCLRPRGTNRHAFSLSSACVACGSAPVGCGSPSGAISGLSAPGPRSAHRAARAYLAPCAFRAPTGRALAFRSLPCVAVRHGSRPAFWLLAPVLAMAATFPPACLFGLACSHFGFLRAGSRLRSHAAFLHHAIGTVAKSGSICLHALVTSRLLG